MFCRFFRPHEIIVSVQMTTANTLAANFPLAFVTFGLFSTIYTGLRSVYERAVPSDLDSKAIVSNFRVDTLFLPGRDLSKSVFVSQIFI